jgi:hypothetical protein
MTSVVNHIRAASVIKKEQDVAAVYNGRSPQPFPTQQKGKIAIPWDFNSIYSDRDPFLYCDSNEYFVSMSCTSTLHKLCTPDILKLTALSIRDFRKFL